MTVVPWICHLCRSEFDALKGGLCKICNEPTCLACFEYKQPQKATSIKEFQDRMCISCAEFKKCCEDKGIPWQDELKKLSKIKARIRKIEEKALSMINKKHPPDDTA